jgi:hypothetical protein
MFNLINKILRIIRRSNSPQAIVRQFASKRESLQEQFFDAAAIAGTPRGLRWVRCDWLPDQVLLRDKSTGQFNLLVGVNIAFEAIEGGDMEGLAAVSTIRDACAVFQWNDGAWRTAGKALFNMSPADAAPRLGASYELVPLS